MHFIYLFPFQLLWGGLTSICKLIENSLWSSTGGTVEATVHRTVTKEAGSVLDDRGLTLTCVNTGWLQVTSPWRLTKHTWVVQQWSLWFFLCISRSDRYMWVWVWRCYHHVRVLLQLGGRHLLVMLLEQVFQESLRDTYSIPLSTDKSNPVQRQDRQSKKWVQNNGEVKTQHILHNLLTCYLNAHTHLTGSVSLVTPYQWEAYSWLCQVMAT